MISMSRLFLFRFVYSNFPTELANVCLQQRLYDGFGLFENKIKIKKRAVAENRHIYDPIFQ